MKRFLELFLITLLLTVAVSCGKEKGRSELRHEEISASTITVPARTVWLGRSFPGRVEAKNRIELSSRMSAYVTDVKVNEGDHVKKGQLLLTIDERSLKEQIQALRATLRQIEEQKKALLARVSYARSQYRRYSALLKDGAVTRQEFERIKSDYDSILKQTEAISAREKSIQARIKEVETNLSYTSISAPTDGTVIRRFVDPGTFVNMGQPLVSMEAPQKGYWFKAQVDEGLLESAQEIPGVVVSIPSAGIHFFTRSVLVVPDIDRETHTFTAKVDLSMISRKSMSVRKVNDGMYGRLIWLTGTRTTVVIPSETIIARGEIKGVYVLDGNNIVHFRVIKTGSFFTPVNMNGKEMLVPAAIGMPARPGSLPKGTRVEILSGLQQGDKIVSSNLYRVSEGNRVK